MKFINIFQPEKNQLKIEMQMILSKTVYLCLCTAADTQSTKIPSGRNYSCT